MLSDNNKNDGSIYKGALSLSLAALTVKILGLIYKIPLSHIIGDEGMGYFNSAYTIYSFFYLLCTAGMPKAITIMISELRTKDLKCTELRVVRSCLVAFGLMGLLISVIFELSSNGLSQIIGNSKAAKTILYIAPSVFFVALSGVIKGYFNGAVKLLPIAISQLIEAVSKLGLGLLFALYAKNKSLPFEIISAYTILGITIGSVLSFVYLYVELKIHFKDDKSGQNVKTKIKYKGVIGRIIRISVPLTLSAAILSITNIIDLGLIMRRLYSIGFSEENASALYGNYTTMAVPMHSFVLSLLTPITVAVLPVLRKHFINGEKELFKKTLNDTFRTCTFLVTPCMFGLVFFAKESLGLVFPKESATIAAPLLAITSVGMLFSIWHIIANTALEAGGNIKAPLISMLISCAVKLSVSYVLIGDPDYGILGAPIGTVASYATSFLISAICLYRLQRIRISVSRHFIIAAASSFFSVYAAFLFYNKSNLINDYNLRFITSVIIAIILYMILYYVFGLHRVLQKKHRQNVQNSGRIII